MKRNSLNNILRSMILILGGENLTFQKTIEYFRIKFGIEEDMNLDDIFRDW